MIRQTAALASCRPRGVTSQSLTRQYESVLGLCGYTRTRGLPVPVPAGTGTGSNFTGTGRVRVQ